MLTLSASWKRSVNVSTLASWKRTTSDTAAETSAVRRVAFKSLATLSLTEFVPFTLTLARRRAPMRMSQRGFWFVFAFGSLCFGFCSLERDK